MVAYGLQGRTAKQALQSSNATRQERPKARSTALLKNMPWSEHLGLVNSMDATYIAKQGRLTLSSDSLSLPSSRGMQEIDFFTRSFSVACGRMYYFILCHCRMDAYSSLATKDALALQYMEAGFLIQSSSAVFLWKVYKFLY